MAIMQDWAVTLCKIAKMQDGIKSSDWRVDNVADNLSVTLPKIRIAFCISDFQWRILRL